MANPYLDYLAAQFPQLRQAVAQSQQADQLRAMMQQARPNPVMANMLAAQRMQDQQRMAAHQAQAQQNPPPVPLVSGGPSGMLAAPAPATRYGDTLRSVNSQAAPVPAPYPIPVATPQQAMGMAQLTARPNPQQPSTGGWSNANVAALGFDPQVEYQNLIENDVAPLTARQWVEDGIKEREMRYRQEQGIAMSTAKAAETPPGFDLNRPVNAAGDAVGTTAETVMPFVQPVLDYGQKQARIAQADAVVSAVKTGRDAGWTDRQIMNEIKDPLNPFMWSLPFGEFDSDAEITAFFDGLLNAYDEGFVAYGQDTIAPGQVGMGPTKPIVGQWGPGAEAAHEYMAGEENVLEKITEAVVLDPLNAVGGVAAGGRGLSRFGATLAAKGPTGAKVAGRVIQGTGAGLRAPDAVLNVAPDLIVGKVLGGTINMVGENVPGLNLIYDKLRRTPDNIHARSTAEDDVDALNQSDRVAQGAANATPPEVDIVGPPPTPPVVPDPSGPNGATPPASSYPQTDTALIPRIPGMNDGTTTGVQYGPGAYGPLADPETGSAGLHEWDFGDDIVPGQKTLPEDDLTDIVDATPPGDPAIVDEMATPPAPDPTIPQSRRLATDGMTREQRNAAIKAGKITSLTPWRDGERLIDEAWRRGDADPAGWDAFYTEYKPKVEDYKIRKAEVDGTWYDTIAHKQIAQVALGIEHTIDDVIPSFQAAGKVSPAYADLPPVKPTSKRAVPEPGDVYKSGPRKGQQKEKLGYQDKNESIPYLMERYVYEATDTDAANIRKALERRPEIQNAPWAEPILARLDAARAKMQAIKATVVPEPTSLGSALTPEEAAVVDAYQNAQHGGSKIARAARDPGDPANFDRVTRRGIDISVPDAIVHLDSAIAKHVLPTDAILYRGINLRRNPEVLQSLQPGDPFTDAGYMSTSRSEEMAQKWAGVDPQQSFMLEIRAPAGTPGLEIPRAKFGPDEQEILLPRNGRWRVVSVEDRPYYPRRIVIEPASTLSQTGFGAEAAGINPLALGNARARQNVRRLFAGQDAPPLLSDGPRVTNPAAQLAFKDQQRLATRFTGASNPDYAGKTLREVRDDIREGLQATVARGAEIDAMLADPATIPLPKTKAAQAKFDVKKEITKLRKEKLRLAQPYSKYGDVYAADLNSLSNELAGLAHELDVNPNVFKKLPLAVDLVDALIRRVPRHLLIAEPITSTGYSMRNIIGNAQVGMLADPAYAEELVEYTRAGLRETRDVLRPNAIEIPAEQMSLGARVSGDLGRGLKKQYTKAAEWGTAHDVIGIGSWTPTRILAQRLHLDKIPRAFDAKRSFDSGWDRAGKTTFYGHTLRGTATEEIPDLVDLVTKLSVRRDLAVTRDDWTRLFTELRKPETGVFSPDDVFDAVYRVARDRGLDTTRARNIAKPAADRWENLAKEAEDRAVELTNHAFPSQRRMTNADTYLSYVTLFHFWPSRTARLVLEEMIRHPQLYNWWQKSHDGLERMAEEGNYPDSVRMLMYIAESPFGFALYANPVSLYLVTALNPDAPDYPDAKGVTKLGSVLKDIRQQTGLGLAPFLDAALNIAGVYGDSFPPNPWPSRAAELAGASLDYALIRMGHSPGTPIYDNTMAKLRSWVSGSAIAPGTSNVPYRDQSTFTQDIVGSLVLDNNPELAERILQTEMGADGRVHPTADATAARIEFAAIMENEDHPEYQQAELDAAAQKATTLGVNAISPFSIKAKVSSREWAIQGAGGGWDAIEAGKEPSPYEAGMMQTRDVVNSTPEDNILQAQENQFYALGSDRQNALSDGWTAIAYPDDTLIGGGLGITIGGTFISRDDLVALEQSQRSDIADAWVAEQGGTEELQAYRDEKAKYIAEHPEYADFDGYKDIAYKYEGGVRAFRLDRAEANPNFNRAMEAKRSDLKDDGMNAKLIEAELDQWATSIAGYEAAQGITGGLYDPEPISTGDQATIDTIAKMGGTGTGGGFGGGVSGTGKPGKSTSAKLKADMAEYEHDLKIVEGVIRQNGIDIGPDGLSSVTGSYAVESLNSMFGDLMPQKTNLQRDYEEWVTYQPRGADTSPAAFGAYLDTLAADETLNDLLAAAAD
jgi:hypothetical protein